MSNTTTHSINAGPRTLRAIATDIRGTWGDKLHTAGYAAKSSLDALEHLDTINDTYTHYLSEGSQFTGEHLVRTFLSHAHQFKGEQARYLKEELRAHLPRRR